MSLSPDYHTDSRNAVGPTIEDAWITAFIDHGRYLRGWSARTCHTYQQGLRTLAAVPLTKIGLTGWMRTQQQRGLKPGGVNMYARSVNSFLTWAHEENLLPERLRIRLSSLRLSVIAGRSADTVLIAYTRGVLSRKCPKCGRIASIRVERTFKAEDYRTTYSCTVCGSSWTTTPRPTRKPPKRKHTWLA